MAYTRGFEGTGSRDRLFRPSHYGIAATQCVFCATKCVRSGFVEKKMRLGVIDSAIILRLWNMNRLMLRLGFATAKRSPLF